MPTPPALDLDFAREVIVALLDARDFLALQLTRTNGGVSDEEFDEAATQYLSHTERTDAELVKKVSTLAQLIPERLDTEIVSTVFHCDLQRASRALLLSAAQTAAQVPLALPSTTRKPLKRGPRSVRPPIDLTEEESVDDAQKQVLAMAKRDVLVPQWLRWRRQRLKDQNEAPELAKVLSGIERTIEVEVAGICASHAAEMAILERQRDEARAEIERLRTQCDGCADAEVRTGAAHYSDCPVGMLMAERDRLLSAVVEQAEAWDAARMRQIANLDADAESLHPSSDSAWLAATERTEELGRLLGARKTAK